MSSFVHLHVHSEYSLFHGAARISHLVEQASFLGMDALALTDEGVMYGVVSFYKACKRKNIKPIIGCQVYVTGASVMDIAPLKEGTCYPLLLLAKDINGYQNLIKICSMGQMQRYDHHLPKVHINDLLAHAQGIVCISVCVYGEISQYLLKNRQTEAEAIVEQYVSVFGSDFYLELHDHGTAEQKLANQQLISLATRMDVQLVATNEVYYVRQEDAYIQHVIHCIRTGEVLNEQIATQEGTDQRYLKRQAEMSKLFSYVPKALENSRSISMKCNVELVFDQFILPQYHSLPVGSTASNFLRELCMKGLKSRYENHHLWMDTKAKEKLVQRLNDELAVIQKMDFTDYFLIVWDFVSFAHCNGIATGPGRGSSAGSLVAYVLRITNVDPVEHQLLFERFLNPDRMTMPDIDIDFSDERRDEVIQYVATKYGSDCVAQIITFGTLAARAAVRDVGRVLQMSLYDVDRIARLIPSQLGISLAQALVCTPKLAEVYKNNDNVRKLLQTAMKVEGTIRHASTHAAGIVISHTPLTHYVPLQKGNGEIAITQYDMNSLQAIGLLKIDILGLRTLSIMERCQQFIGLPAAHLDEQTNGYDDAKTYDMLSQGETIGIFQLESAGVRRVLKELKPTKFEDIITVLALYRPGPMDFIPQYIKAKRGEVEVVYANERLRSILKDTFGIIIYQEQIMHIAFHMAGFTLAQADVLRRSISKKNKAVLEQQRARFVQGSVQQGYTEQEANEVYAMIVRFANYGFPRAHAAAYGVIAFQMTYLKAHYPVEFMAAMLTSVIGNKKKVAQYVMECRKMDILILPPDVNKSRRWFSPVLVTQINENKRTQFKDDVVRGCIQIGLAAIKNVGTQVVDHLLHIRKKNPFVSLLDFCRRVDLRICNKRVIECLIQVGAFDEWCEHRAQLLSILEDTISGVLNWKKERDELQIELFDFDFVETCNWEIVLADIDRLSLAQQLELERDLLGFYISGHPLDGYEQWRCAHNIQSITEVMEVVSDQRVVTIGRVVSLKKIYTKKGNPMAFLELEDQIQCCETVLFPEVWRTSQNYVQKGELLRVRGTIQWEEEQCKLLAEEVQLLRPESIKHTTCDDELTSAKLFIKIPASLNDTTILEKLKTILQQHPGNMDTVLFYEQKQQGFALSKNYLIFPSRSLLNDIQALLGKGTVKVR